MSTGGRTNWKDRAEELQADLDDITEVAKEWQRLASAWRERSHAYEDELVTIRSSMTALEPDTVSTESEE